jgi:hypothetical protein
MKHPPEVENRTRYAVELLRKTCLMYFTDRAGLAAVLDEKYKRALRRQGAERAGIRAGRKGRRCMAGRDVAENELHDCFRGGRQLPCPGLSRPTARCCTSMLKTWPSTCAIPAASTSSITRAFRKHAKLVKTSEFIVKAPDGGIILTAVATTKDNPKNELAESVLSVFRPPPK